MKPLYALLALLLLPAGARAVYAPIPELERGKAMTVYLATGAYYDTNIFGAATGELDSWVYTFSPTVAFNMSLSPRTLASAQYKLALDYVADRPGTKTLDSHELVGRLNHTFAPETELGLSNSYQIAENPESLLPGVATVLSTDQSFRRNQFDTRFAHSLTRRTGIVVKGRATHFDYRNPELSRGLDRDEYLGGLTVAYAVWPTLKANAEYRHQTIVYAQEGQAKDKQSDFGLIGLDYVLTARLAVSSRGGFEYRQRKGDEETTSPYAELGLKYDYAQGSYLSLGYSYSLEETSNVDLYTDASMHRFFANVRQALASRWIATLSATWAPGTLQGRQGIGPDREETNTQLGLALTYQPNRRWSVSTTCDIDKVASEDPSRDLDRQRIGVAARYAF